jgi:hypothetical protein
MSAHFLWLKESVWEASHGQYFVDQRFVLPAQIFRPPPMPGPNQVQRLTVVGRWVLSFESSPQGWVEVQEFEGHFKSYLVLFGSSEQTFLKRETGLSALSYFISALFIITKADIVHLIGATSDLQSKLVELGWGTKETLASPHPRWLLNKADKAFISFNSIGITDRWWTIRGHLQEREALSYLSKKLEREDHVPFAGPRPRNIFERLATRVSNRKRRTKRWQKKT